ncbi:hypothetical protein BJ742DRAFT_443896 [Cladochytrium replicatum]|nr:hypothetical protein BJ742DRAFT_443896 [Cladochytrium replicatum]
MLTSPMPVPLSVTRQALPSPKQTTSLAAAAAHRQATLGAPLAPWMQTVAMKREPGRRPAAFIPPPPRKTSPLADLTRDEATFINLLPADIASLAEELRKRLRLPSDAGAVPLRQLTLVGCQMDEAAARRFVGALKIPGKKDHVAVLELALMDVELRSSAAALVLAAGVPAGNAVRRVKWHGHPGPTLRDGEAMSALKAALSGKDAVGLGGVKSEFGFMEEWCDAFAAGVRENAGLSGLDLSRTGLYPGGLCGVLGALRELGGLESLVLDYNKGLGDLDASGIAQSLGMAAAAGNAPVMSLKVLSMRSAELTGASLRTLASALRSNETLETVNLSGNPGAMDDPVALAEFLGVVCTHPSLKTLNLSDCNLSVDDARVIADALREPKCGLARLHLSKNDLRSEGVATLARALGECGSIEELWIDSNGVRNDGVGALAAYFQGHGAASAGKLRVLHLEGNTIGEAGVRKLMESMEIVDPKRMVKPGEGVTSVFLDGNPVRDAPTTLHCDLRLLGVEPDEECTAGDDAEPPLPLVMVPSVDAAAALIRKAVQSGRTYAERLRFTSFSVKRSLATTGEAIAPFFERCMGVVDGVSGSDIRVCEDDEGDELAFSAERFAELLGGARGIESGFVFRNMSSRDVGLLGYVVSAASAVPRSVEQLEDPLLGLRRLHLVCTSLLSEPAVKALANALSELKFLEELGIQGVGAIPPDSLAVEEDGEQEFRGSNSNLAMVPHSAQMGQGRSVSDPFGENSKEEEPDARDLVHAVASAVFGLARFRKLALRSVGVGRRGISGLTLAMKEQANLEHGLALRSLDLDGNFIDDEGAAELASGLDCGLRLVELSLRQNRIGSAGVEALSASLGGTAGSELKRLMLEGNQLSVISSAGFHRLARSFDSAVGDLGGLTGELGLSTRFSALESLSLSHNGIDDVGATTLFEALLRSENSSLRRLNLDGNSISLRGCEALSRWLACGSTRLNAVSLCANGLESLTGKGLRNRGAKIIADGLVANGTRGNVESKNAVRYVNLGSNMIGEEGALELAAAVRATGVVSTLGLEDNAVGDKGFMALLSIPGLQRLWIGRNSITDHGLLAFEAEAPQGECELVELGLSGNAVEDDGANSIARMVMGMDERVVGYLGRLKRLDVSANRIGKQGVTSLAQCILKVEEEEMGESRGLVVVVVDGNPVRPGVVVDIVRGGGVRCEQVWGQEP